MALEKLTKDAIGRYTINNRKVAVEKISEATIGELLYVVRASRGKYDPIEYREHLIPDGADAYSFEIVDTAIKSPFMESLEDYAVFKLEFFRLKQ